MFLQVEGLVRFHSREFPLAHTHAPFLPAYRFPEAINTQMVRMIVWIRVVGTRD